MNRKAIGLIYYNEPKGVRRLLDSVPDDWCKICIDGAFPQMNSKNEWSSDKQIEWMSDYKNTILVSFSGDEWEKRQAYFDLSKDYHIDVLVVVDSDEYFKLTEGYTWADVERYWGDLNVKEPTVYYINCYDVYDGFTTPVTRPRVFTRPEMFKYHNKHHYQITKDGSSILKPAGKVIPFHIIHDKRFRSEKARKQHEEYMKYLRNYELTKMKSESKEEKIDRELSVAYGY